MSSLVGNALPQFIHREDDKRTLDEFYTGEELYPYLLLRYDGSDVGKAEFSSPFWPRCSSLMGGSDGVNENCFISLSPCAGDPWPASGCNGRLGFVGFTRDAFGSPVGGCTVRCFNTATNELVSQVVSDANGFYQATTPYADGHYLVVHKAGPPDIAGASISTLTPS